MGQHWLPIHRQSTPSPSATFYSTYRLLYLFKKMHLAKLTTHPSQPPRFGGKYFNRVQAEDLWYWVLLWKTKRVRCLGNTHSLTYVFNCCFSLEITDDNKIQVLYWHSCEINWKEYNFNHWNKFALLLLYCLHIYWPQRK